MLILRYFGLLLAYHLLTFYKQRPLAFLLGVILWPYHVISRLMHPTEAHPEVVQNGINGLKSYWQIEGAVLPPAFIRRRFETLQRDASRL